jgi:hypothetical protein
MVAQISGETFTRSSLTPEWDASDSDDLVLALETARALEAQGEIREAVRWLRRAAEEAEKDGHDERVLVLARAAAELANMIGPASSPVSSPPTVTASMPASVRAPAPKPAPRAPAASNVAQPPVPQAPLRTVSPSARRRGFHLRRPSPRALRRAHHPPPALRRRER